jgi:hypothetical protein
VLIYADLGQELGPNPLRLFFMRLGQGFGNADPRVLLRRCCWTATRTPTIICGVVRRALDVSAIDGTIMSWRSPLRHPSAAVTKA